jgi:prophage regulatory protein
MSFEHSPGRRILRAKAVMSRMGWSRTTLWRRVRAGEFPAPVKTGQNINGWFDDEVGEAQENLSRVTYASAPEAA